MHFLRYNTADEATYCSQKQTTAVVIRESLQYAPRKLQCIVHNH
jgi:hypothetical protein